MGFQIHHNYTQVSENTHGTLSIDWSTRAGDGKFKYHQKKNWTLLLMRKYDHHVHKPVLRAQIFS